MGWAGYISILKNLSFFSPVFRVIVEKFLQNPLSETFKCQYRDIMFPANEIAE